MRRLLHLLLLAGCEDNVTSEGGGYVDGAPIERIDGGGSFRDASDDCPGGGSGGSGCVAADASSGPDAEPEACGEAVFAYTGATATEVFVTGDFSAWSDEPPGALALVSDGAGHFSGTRYLGPGKHIYKLIVDGAWMADPANPASEPDGFGGSNSVLVLCERR